MAVIMVGAMIVAATKQPGRRSLSNHGETRDYRDRLYESSSGSGTSIRQRVREIPPWFHAIVLFPHGAMEFESSLKPLRVAMGQLLGQVASADE